LVDGFFLGEGCIGEQQCTNEQTNFGHTLDILLKRPKIEIKYEKKDIFL